VPVISKTAKYTPYLLADYGGVTKYIHHVLSIPGAAQVFYFVFVFVCFVCMFLK
jgi:hypothetical protein